MSDTWRQNAIVQAIQIIADKKIAQAGYDKTRKGVISQVIDKTSGKYRVKYQDSQFQAYATSSNVYYEVGQLVSFLVPGNDWSREITIINGVKNYATNYAEVPEASQLYNKTGPNPLKINDKSNKRTVYGLCSYKDTEDSLVYKDESDKEEPFLIINQQVGKTYIPQGNGLVIGMDVQTSLDSGQVNGNYGLRFDLIFRNIQTGSQNSEIDFSQGGAAVRSYFVTDRDVIGNPYSLTKTTTVEHLLNIDDINPVDFIGIKDIVAYCNDFSQGQDGKQYSNDIFFSNIHINGVKVLSEEDLNGYMVHIDHSETGQILDKSLNLIKLQASLKVNGKKVTSEDQLSYYWFRQNGLIFRNSPRYSSYGGDGWECLNNFSNGEPSQQNKIGKPIPATNTIYFTNSENKITNTPLTVSTLEKNTRIKCVVVYQYKETSGFQNVIDNTKISFYIDSNQKQTSDNINKIDYYLDYGMPSLTCLPQGYKQGDDLSNYTFSWSVVPARGQAIQIQEIDDTRYEDIKNKEDLYDKAQKQIEKVPQADQDKYKEATGYQAKVDNYEEIKNTSYVKDNVYYNFPISSIVNYSKIICSIHEGDTYKGSASITLYNHTQVPDTYSLNIENSTQVFQYDGKGNSPTSLQLEKPLQIKPLSFTLIDDEGNQVSYQQIINNGYVEWIIPIQNTLLISDDEKNGSPLDNALLIGTDKALAASLGYEVNIYKRPSKEEGQTSNLSSFVYKIADTYDSKKINNNIRLDVKYKDMLFTAYTDFTFPKDGDPGTNGTDYVGKLVSIDSKGENINTDRLYVDSQGNRYTDNGNQFDKLKFQLYNNSNVVDNTANFWTCPPKTSFEETIADVNNAKHYINVNSEGEITRNIFDYNVQIDKVVDIVRAQNGTGNDIKYFAQYPICFSYLNNNNYRFKVRPKTGFKYVVYAQDGTSPDYDKTLPFEIIVEEYKGYFIETTDELSYQWNIVQDSYLQLDDKLNENNNINITLGISTASNKCYFKPKDKFVSTDLFSAIFIRIKKGNTELGWIHIPIYMIINRYGHSALNSWDGNTVQIDKNGNGSILAPQIAAGTKDSSTNTFTGITMGQIAVNGNHSEIGSNGDIGLMGYHQGQRSIFLDSKTGKAEFGKQGAGKIILNPNEKINGKDTALIYSGNYPINDFKDSSKGNYNVVTTGNLSENRNKDNKGLMIDLSTPQIGFGSGNFTVNQKGQLVAKGGGQIAGWTINDEALYKHDGTNKTGMRSTGDPAFYAGTNDQSTNSYNFYVNHNGYLFGKSGNIAGWDFNDKSLSKSNVGMNSDPNNPVYSSIAKHNSKAFFANGDNFYVTHDGYLKSTSGDIGGWDITTTELMKADTQGNRLTLSPTAGISLYNTNSTNGEKFTVNAAGYLTSTFGTIGGWHIEKDKLWAKGDGSTGKKSGIRLSANGSMTGGEGYNVENGKVTAGTWTINADGTSTFDGITTNHIIANNGGQIAGWEINKNSLSADGITINSEGGSGSIYCGKGGNKWKILSNGEAYFSNIYGKVMDNKELVGNGMTMAGSGGTSIMSPNCHTGGYGTGASAVADGTWYDFLTLRVKNLVVDGTFTVDGVDTEWTTRSFISSLGDPAGSLSYDDSVITVTYQKATSVDLKTGVITTENAQATVNITHNGTSSPDGNTFKRADGVDTIDLGQPTSYKIRFLGNNDWKK